MSTTKDASHKHRSRLDQTRTEIKQRLASLTANFDEIVDAAADVATDDEHDPEGHTIAWERQQVAALVREANAALAEVDQAEARLDARMYGVCIDCRSNISADRLDALPTTPSCVSCAANIRPT